VFASVFNAVIEVGIVTLLNIQQLENVLFNDDNEF
jgi:hypothetical protein